MTVRECREPEVEAAKLVGPRVPVIRSAQEGRQLLERMGAGGSGTSRLPRNRALEARSLLLQAHEASTRDRHAERNASPDPTTPPTSMRAESDDPEGPGDADAAILPHSGHGSANLDGIEGRLRASAAAAAHWALASARGEVDRLSRRATVLRKAVITVATLVVVLIGALIIVRGPIMLVVTGAGLLSVLLLAVAFRRAELGAAEADASAVAIEIDILAHQGLPPSARADLLAWPTILARNGLAQLPPERVDEVVEELWRRGTAPTPPARSSPLVPMRAVGPLDEKAAPLPEFDLVVVVDSGLHVGHRLALRDVSARLAHRVPLLVLATNEKLWHMSGPDR